MFCDNLEVEWDGRLEGISGVKEHMYTCGFNHIFKRKKKENVTIVVIH